MKRNQSRTTQGVGETLKDLGSGIVKGTADAVKDIATGTFEQLFGFDSKPTKNHLEKREIEERFPSKEILEKKKPIRKIERTLFRWTDYREQVVVKRKIEQLIQEIRAEAEALKKTTASITAEVKEIEKIALERLPEKVGVYHVRFLEIILKLVKSLRAKASESKTWLEALLTRKKKRGSLFLALAKKKGTQYSLSEELKMARNVQ